MSLVNNCDFNAFVDPNLNTKWEDKKDQAKRDHTIKRIAQAALFTLVIVSCIPTVGGFCALVFSPLFAPIPICLMILGITAGCGLVCAASVIGTYNVGKDLTPYHRKEVAQRMVQNLKTKTLEQVAKKSHQLYDNVHTHNLAKYGFISKKAGRTIRELVKQHKTIKEDLRKFTYVGLDEATKKQHRDRLNDLETRWNNFRDNVVVPNLPNPLNLAAPAA